MRICRLFLILILAFLAPETNAQDLMGVPGPFGHPMYPSKGYATFRIVWEGEKEKRASRGDKSMNPVLENEYYRLTVDPAKGVISSLFDKELNKELMDPDLPNLLVVHARPASSGDGIILHLRETEGDHAILDIRELLNQTGASKAFEVNVLGEEIGELTKSTLIEHYEARFVFLKK